MESQYTILAAIDGTPLTPAVVDLACEVAQAQRGVVTLLYVQPPAATAVIGGFPPTGVPLPRQSDEERDTILERAVADVEHHGIATQVRHRDGWGGSEIVQAARETHCNTIVMGCHGHTVFGRLFQGCVASYVRRHAVCPVLVAPG